VDIAGLWDRVLDAVCGGRCWRGRRGLFCSMLVERKKERDILAGFAEDCAARELEGRREIFKSSCL
jgi:hypothetical protein